MGLQKKWRMENWRTALVNDMRGAPDSKVEDTWAALGNDIHGAPKKVENGELANSATQ